jgi:hypothetical protein
MGYSHRFSCETSTRRWGGGPHPLSREDTDPKISFGVLNSLIACQLMPAGGLVGRGEACAELRAAGGVAVLAIRPFTLL